jgi:hypothetical protein
MYRSSPAWIAFHLSQPLAVARICTGRTRSVKIPTKRAAGPDQPGERQLEDRGAMNQQALSSFLWSVAALLRGDHKQSEYGRVVLPFTAFRIQRESRRLYPGYAANDPDFSMPLAA